MQRRLTCLALFASLSVAALSCADPPKPDQIVAFEAAQEGCSEAERNAPEICDGDDNNCDGLIDAQDSGMVAESCGLPDGVCNGALRSVFDCAEGKWPDAPCSEAYLTETVADYEAIETRCDGLDNDCDGTVDEGCDGTEECVPNDDVDVCDGIDNDCDGEIDEEQAKLSCGKGVCANDAPSCVGGIPQPEETCVPKDVATEEICDDLDNDCDDTVDEDLGDHQCGVGQCANTAPKCVAGEPQGLETCVPKDPATEEVCDGLDHDCDGETDDIPPQECDLENEHGTCTGSMVCQQEPEGVWAESCEGVFAVAEYCNGQDMDCDDVVDEGFPDTDGDGKCDDFDEDNDGDGIANYEDSCPLLENPVQTWGLDDPAACCGCPDGPDGATETFACVDGACVSATCLPTHYDNTDIAGVNCEARDVLWVDGFEGSDSKTGLSAGTAVKTITKALELAEPWTLIKVKAAVYDEQPFIRTRGVRMEGYGDGDNATAVIEPAFGTETIVNIGASDVILGGGLALRNGTKGVNVSLPYEADCSSGAFGPSVEVDIAGDEGWQSSGVTLKGGTPTLITATGEWANDADSSGWGPEGDSVEASEEFPCPGLPQFALVARVGGGDCQLVGPSAAVEAGEGGVLELAMNDFGYEDNSGSMAVEIDVCRVQNIRIEDILIEGLISNPDSGEHQDVHGIAVWEVLGVTIERVTIEDLNAANAPLYARTVGIKFGGAGDITVRDVTISDLVGGVDGDATQGIQLYECTDVTFDTVEIHELAAGERGHAVGISLGSVRGDIALHEVTISDVAGGHQSTPTGDPLVNPGAAAGIDVLVHNSGTLDPIVMRHIRISDIVAGAITDETDPVMAGAIRLNTDRQVSIRHLAVSGVHAAGEGHTAEQLTGQLMGVEIESAYTVTIEQAVFHDIGAGLTTGVDAGRAVVLNEWGVIEDVRVQNTIVHAVRGVAFEDAANPGSAGDILVYYGLIGPDRPWHYPYHYGQEAYGTDVDLVGVQWWADPLFVDPDAGDFHLLPGSPAIDGGAPASLDPFDEDGAPNLHPCWEPQHNGDFVNLGYHGSTAEAAVRPGAPFGEGCEDFVAAPGCADAYMGDAIDGASCGCFDSGIGEVDAPCYGTLGQCDEQPGVVICEETLSATACSAQVDGEDAYAGTPPGCDYSDANCDGVYDSSACGTCLNPADQSEIAEGLQDNPAWLVSGWFNDQGCLEAECLNGDCDIPGCADTGGPLSAPCEACLLAHAHCLNGAGCAPACWENGMGGLTSPECLACTQSALCDLARDKCAFVGPDGLHPCETLCDMYVDSGCVDAADHTSCLAACSGLEMLSADADLDTVACRIARLQDGESCEGVEALCADLDQDGQNPHMGDCDEDHIDIYAGGPELCDGLDNDCDDVIDEAITDCSESAPICLGAEGCVGGDSCLQPLFGTVNGPEGLSAESGVTVSDQLGLDGATAFTVGAWVRSTMAVDNHGPIVETPWFRLTVQHSKLRVTAKVTLEDGEPGCEAAFTSINWIPQHTVTPSPHRAEDTWMYVAATWDGTNLSTYVNGNLAVTRVVAGGASALEAGCVGDTTIGYHLEAPEGGGEMVYEGANAVIRHVSIWREVLDGPTQLAVAQGQVHDGELVAYWPLDEGQGQVALDVSGQGRHGTYLDTTEWFDETAPGLEEPPLCALTSPLTCVGDTSISRCTDDDGDDQIPLAGDCDDDEVDVYRGAPALCDGLQNDCLAAATEPEDGLCAADQLCVGALGCLNEAVCEPPDCMGPAQCDALVFGDQDTETESQAIGVVRVEPSSHLVPPEIAVTAWVRQSEPGDAALVTGTTWALEIADGGLIGRTTLCDGTLVSETPPTDVQMTVGDWHHVAFQHDALSGSRVYLNGQLLTWSEGVHEPLESCPFDGVDKDTGPKVNWIGGTLGDPDGPGALQGQMRHVTIWSVGDLSAERVAQIGQGQVHPDQADHLLAWYPLTQTRPHYTHGHVADVGPHGLDGLWQGPWWPLPTASPPCPAVPITCLDKGVDAPAICADLDQDGWAPLEGDCDDDPDTGALRSPDNTPDDCNGIDDDCDGYVDNQSNTDCGVGEKCVGVEGCLLGTPCQAYHFGYDGDVLLEGGINLPDLNLVPGEPATLAAWVLQTGWDADPGPIIQTPTIRLSMTSSGPMGTMSYGPCDLPSTFYVQLNYSIPDQGVVPLNSYSWNFLALTWDGETLRTWINGHVGAETTPDWTMTFEPDCTGTTSIGHGPDLDTGGSAFAHAAIRHASIWRRALDGPELAGLAVGKLPNGGGLEGYWPMDEDIPFTAPDVSGNAHHGTHTTPATWATPRDGGDEALLCLPLGAPGCAEEPTALDPYCLDADEDGVSLLEGDCDESSPNASDRYPDNPEVCDGVDNDCDGYIDGAPNAHYTSECAEVDTTCLGTLGCIGGTECQQALFGIMQSAPDVVSAESGVTVSANLGLDGATAFTVGAWVRRMDWDSAAGPLLETPWFKITLTQYSTLNVGARFEDGAPGCDSSLEHTVYDWPEVLPAIPFQEWVYVSATWDGETMSAYINGQLETSFVFGDGTKPLESGCTGESTIGYHLVDAGDGQGVKYEGANAVIRHLSVWRTALDIDTQLDLAEGILPTADLVAFWPLDEGGGGDVARDLSGQGRKGRYLETTAWFDASTPGFDVPASCPPATALTCADTDSNPLCANQDGDDFTPLEGDCQDEHEDWYPGNETDGCDGYDKDCDGDYYDHNPASCIEGTFCAGGMACLPMDPCEAISFSGVEAAWYQVPEDEALRAHKSFTLAAWIRPEVPPEGRDVQGIIDHDAMYGLALGRDGRLQARVRLPAADESCGEAQPWLTVSSLPGTIPLNTWSWVVVAFEASHLRIYRNAIEVGVTETGGLEQLDDHGYLDDSCEGSGLAFGRRGPEGGFVGQMRHAFLLGTAVTSQWQQQLLSWGEVQKSVMLTIRGYWPLSGEGLTDVLQDYSPAQHHAQRVTVDYEASAFFTESCQVLGPSSIGGDLVQCDKSMSWFDAREACVGLGGDLASIHTSGDFALVAEGMGDAAEFWGVWGGLNDLTEEDTFVWSDGSTSDYDTPWAANEPNNAGNAEDCVTMGPDSGWNDLPCNTERLFACRIPPHPVAPEWTSRDDCSRLDVLALHTNSPCEGFDEVSLCIDVDGDGWLPMAGDCDDANDTVHATAEELCDGLDNDCDGSIDPGSTCCGNGFIEAPHEVCDDGNTVGDDACAEDCSHIGYPLAYYDMEEGTGGAIANKSPRTPDLFPGVLHGDAYFQATDNPGAGQHLAFDGDGDFVHFDQGWTQNDSDVWLDAPRFSTAAWVKLNALPEADTGNWTDYFSVVSLSSSGDLNADPLTGEPAHEWESGGGGWRFAFRDADRGVAVSVNSGLDHPSYTTDKWVHLVGTYDGDLMRLYVDGVEVSSRQVGTVNRSYYCSGGSCTGHLAAGSIDPTPLNGAIDEVSLWDEALGPDEVAALYNGGVPASANGLATDGECGDGVLQPGELCDDGNLVVLDGCEPSCKPSLPGDHCNTAILLPDSSFTPVPLSEFGGGPSFQATVTGDTSVATNHYESACENAGPDGPELIYTFAVYGNHQLQLSTDAHLVVHTSAIGDACGWQGGSEWCLDSETWVGQGSLTIGNIGPGLRQVTVDSLNAASAGPFELTVTVYSCGNGVVDHETGEMCDDGNTAGDDGCSSWCQLETEELMVDCAAIHAEVPSSPSGLYDIYPDGDEGSKVTVWCDMETDGGGWTRIYLSSVEDYTSTEIGYTVDHMGLRAASDEVLFGFNDDLANRARLPMSPDWVLYSPMTVQFGSFETSAFINGGTEAKAGTLVYGYGHYGCGCDGTWDVDNDTKIRGRVCFDGDSSQDDDAPFWGLFASEEVTTCGTAQTCAGSNATCETSDRRFAILVRRSVCGNGLVELGESCDDQNAEETDGCTSSCEVYDPLVTKDCTDVLAQAPNAPVGVYSTYPDGVTDHHLYCNMNPGLSCQHPIDIPRDAFVPGECDSGQKCRVATLTGEELGGYAGWAVPGCSAASPDGISDLVYRIDFPWDRVAFAMESPAGVDHVVSWMAQTPGDCFELGQSTNEAGENIDVPWDLPACDEDDDPDELFDGAWRDTGNSPTDSYRLVVDLLTDDSADKSFTLTIATNTCGDGVLDHEVGEQCDDGNRVSGDGCSYNCDLGGEDVVYAVDCAQIHDLVPTSPSGFYNIYPGGDLASQVMVWCDMETDGGGWTRVFLADSDNYEATTLTYAVDHPTLLSTEAEVMIGFADDWSTRARFALPHSWTVTAPMSHELGLETVDAWVNGATDPLTTSLKFGWGSYFTGCDTDWHGSGSAGRICLEATQGPFWSSFADAPGDYCNASDEAWNTTPCDEDRRFAIMVRRPFCGNGIVEHGEGCDDQNTDETDDCISTCEAYVAADSVDCAAILAVAPNAPNGTYSIDPDGSGKGDAPIEVECPMDSPGVGCWNPIDITMADFVPGDCGDVPCRVTTITGDTHNGDDTYDVPGCSAAVASSSDLVYRAEGPWSLVSFDLQSEANLVLSLSLNSATDCAADDNVWVLPACNVDDDPGWLLDGTWQSFGSQWVDGTWQSFGSLDATRLVVDGLDGAAGSFTLTIKVTTCGDGVIDHDTGEACDDGGTDNDDGCSDNCELEIEGYPVDCTQIQDTAPTSPTGLYDIYPDGTEGSLVTVHCDMETQGGGWTRIFLADQDNYNATDIGYTVDSLPLREASNEVMIGFADDWTDWARFALFENWKTQSPMSYSNQEGPDTKVWSPDEPAGINRTVRYGYLDYAANCAQSWGGADTAGSGRICITGSDGPYWSHFADPDGDYCNTSKQAPDTTACSADRRFAIQVRRAVCGNGEVDMGEECDDGGQDHTEGCTTTCQAYDVSASEDCVAIRDAVPDAPSGIYTIDPDGAGGVAPVTVYCDMETDGGGWTRIFIADSADYHDTQLTYTVDIPELRTPSTVVMIGYTPEVGGAVTARARFVMPDSTYWLDSFPLAAPGDDATVSVSIEDGEPTEALLRFGYKNSNPACTSDWGAAPYGRLCITGTEAPYYGGFADETIDHCGTSNEDYPPSVGGVVACDAQRRFAIFVRRPICGDGTIDVGEFCDDANDDNTDGCTTSCEAYAPEASIDCVDILQQAPGAPSGLYTIDPDGNPTTPSTEVWCDMEVDNGGWTRIYVAQSDVLNSITLPYTVDAPQLRAGAGLRAMIAYMPIDGGELVSPTRFPLPAKWVTAPPMTYEREDEEDVMAMVGDDTQPSPATLRYGYDDFSGACDGDWLFDETEAMTLPTWGRVCVQDTDAPFWNGFAGGTSLSDVSWDLCPLSGQLWNAAPCGSARSFAIFTRRPTCGDGHIDPGEDCDDMNPIETDGCTSQCQTYSDAVDCKDILEQAPLSPSGIYTIDPDGVGGEDPVMVTCDMTTEGGGWTVCSDQFLESPTQLGWFQSTYADNWYACHLLDAGNSEALVGIGALSYVYQTRRFDGVDFISGVEGLADAEGNNQLNILADSVYGAGESCTVDPGVTSLAPGSHPGNYHVYLTSEEGIAGHTPVSGDPCKDKVYLMGHAVHHQGCSQPGNRVPNLGYPCETIETTVNFQLAVRRPGPVCGDGHIDPGEDCDEGGATPTCTDQCTVPNLSGFFAVGGLGPVGMWCLVDPTCPAVGPKLWHSPDGDTWSPRPTPIDEVQGQLKAIAQAGDTLVAVGSYGHIITSVNGGLTWAQQSIPAYSGGLLEHVTYGGGRFLVCLAQSCSESTDGLSWSDPFSATHVYPDMPIAYSEVDGLFAGVDQEHVYHTTGDVFWSVPPVAHTLQEPDSGVKPEALIHDGSRFVMAGHCVTALAGGDSTEHTYPSIALSSSVTEPWEVLPIPEGEGSSFHAIAHSPTSGRYVAVGSEGLILYADELPTFHVAETTPGTPITTEATGPFGAVAHGAGRWVAVGDAGQVYLSIDDGESWQAAATAPGTTPGENPDDANLKGMIYRP